MAEVLYDKRLINVDEYYRMGEVENLNGLIRQYLPKTNRFLPSSRPANKPN